MGRWILGGVMAGIVLWVLEGLASLLYVADATAALEAHGLSMETHAGLVVSSLVMSLIGGLVLVFLYAAARPRFGAGPRTAVVVGVALWAGGYLLSLMGHGNMGLFPWPLLVLWGVIGLIEMVVAALVGGWIYRET